MAITQTMDPVCQSGWWPCHSAPSNPAAPSPAYATGKCNIHIWEGLGQETGQKNVHLVVNITDAKEAPIGFKFDGLNWGVALDVHSKLTSL
ncbi:MAG: hypothetical protein M1836_005774 [Candelina mexicana]|nr:MAG: hypothetical protein M1836_005774 [Candelina mexicana]